MRTAGVINALVPWLGSKRTLASEVIAELGDHSQYFEPCCGSMSVLLCKPPAQKETANDLHGDLVNLARVVQNLETAEALYHRLERLLFSEDLLEQSREQMRGPCDFDLHSGFDPLERAYWYFIASWMGRNGTAGTDRDDYQIAVRWTKSGGSPTVRFSSAVNSIPWWHRRLQNVVILKRDLFRIIDRFEDIPETAIYVDPPYHAASRSKIDDGRGGRYLHEFDHAVDHVRLRDALAVYRQARVVVSYYDCPEIRSLYAGWTFVEHTRQKHLHAQNGRGARPKDAPEVLILNGPSLSPTGLNQGGLFE